MRCTLLKNLSYCTPSSGIFQHVFFITLRFLRQRSMHPSLFTGRTFLFLSFLGPVHTRHKDGHKSSCARTVRFRFFFGRSKDKQGKKKQCTRKHERPPCNEIQYVGVIWRREGGKGLCFTVVGILQAVVSLRPETAFSSLQTLDGARRIFTGPSSTGVVHTSSTSGKQSLS